MFRIYLNPDLEREEGEGSGGRPRGGLLWRCSLHHIGVSAASYMSFGRDDPVIRQLHTQVCRPVSPSLSLTVCGCGQVRQFLADEEQEMEQRIRDFERREKETFARLQRKTLTHRTLLCS